MLFTRIDRIFVVWDVTIAVADRQQMEDDIDRCNGKDGRVGSSPELQAVIFGHTDPLPGLCPSGGRRDLEVRHRTGYYAVP